MSKNLSPEKLDAIKKRQSETRKRVKSDNSAPVVVDPIKDTKTLTPTGSVIADQLKETKAASLLKAAEFAMNTAADIAKIQPIPESVVVLSPVIATIPAVAITIKDLKKDATIAGFSQCSSCINIKDVQNPVNADKCYTCACNIRMRMDKKVIETIYSTKIGLKKLKHCTSYITI